MMSNGKLIGKQNVLVNASSTNGIWYAPDVHAASTSRYWPQYFTPQTWATSKIGWWTGKSFSVAAQEATPFGIAFGNNGLALYVVGTTGDSIDQYTLSTAWDISTATFTRTRALGIGDLGSITFRSTGTTFFVLATATDTIYQYSLSTAWNISSTLTQVSNKVVTAQDSTPQGIEVSADGLNLYMIGSTTDTVYQYTMTSAWTLSTASAAAAYSFSVAGSETLPRSVAFNTNGTRMYIVGTSSDTIYQYTLTTAWRVSTATSVQSLPLGATTSLIVPGASITTPYSIAFSNGTGGVTAGRYFYVLDGTLDSIYQFEMRVPYDVTSEWATPNEAVSSYDTSPTSIFLKPDGTRLYEVGTGSDSVREIQLTTPYSVLSRSVISTTPLPTLNPEGIFFKPNGTRMYISYSGSVEQFDLLKAWDPTSLISAGTSSISGGNGLFIDPTGTYLYTSTSSTVYRYTLTTPWDVSSATSSGTLSVTGQTTLEGIWLSSDGLQLYAIGQSVGQIHRYDLTTAWLLSSATLIDTIFLENMDSSVTGITMSPTGNYAYVLGDANNNIYRIAIQN